MKITYTAPNRSHHYPYAEAINRSGNLHAFVSGFSRFSKRSSLPSLGNKLKRHDLIKHVHLACLKLKAPEYLTSIWDKYSAASLDRASFKWAKESDAFIYYRTDGYHTSRRIHQDKIPTLCVMEEVNSHVEFANEILQDEHKRLKLKCKFRKESDYDLRMRGYESADYILCPSEFVKNSFIAKGFASNRIIKVNFGFGTVSNSIIENTTKDKEVFRVLYVGQINYRKGLHYAIEAFKQIHHPQKEFIIVGPKTLTTGLENTTIPKDVIFTGTLKGEALKREYQRASVFVLPSLEEGLALVQGEALSYGIPLLITHNTGGTDLIKDGNEGFIVEPRNIKQIVIRMQQMADDINLLNRMSQRAYETSKKLGNWDVAANMLICQLNNKLKD